MIGKNAQAFIYSGYCSFCEWNYGQISSILHHKPLARSNVDVEIVFLVVVSMDEWRHLEKELHSLLSHFSDRVVLRLQGSLVLRKSFRTPQIVTSIRAECILNFLQQCLQDKEQTFASVCIAVKEYQLEIFQDILMFIDGYTCQTIASRTAWTFLGILSIKASKNHCR